MNVEEVKNRIAICKFCISLLEKEVDDPRQPDALAHYKRQLEILEERLPFSERRKMDEAEAIVATAQEGKPPPTVVHLKPAVIKLKEGSIQS